MWIRRNMVVALPLPEDDETGIRENIFDELKIKDLTKEDGLKI